MFGHALKTECQILIPLILDNDKTVQVSIVCSLSLAASNIETITAFQVLKLFMYNSDLSKKL